MKKCCRPIFITALTLAAIFLILAQFSGIALADGVQIISAPPGKTIAYQGHGSPNSQVTIEVTASISVGVGGDHRYYKSMNGVNIPGGSSFSITAIPVTTFSVSGGMFGIGMTIGSVSGDTGSASMSHVPGGTYNIVVTGISNGSSVSMTVHAYQTQSVDGDGAYTASLSTSGLPAAVYSVKQNGQEVARVYLGVQVPAVPTPIVAPTVTPAANATTNTTTSASALTGNSTTNSTTNVLTNATTNSTINQTANVSASPSTAIGISPTAQPGNNGGQSSLRTTIELLAGAIVAGLLVGYVIVFVIMKK